jgi:hypothetical protein
LVWILLRHHDARSGRSEARYRFISKFGERGWRAYLTDEEDEPAEGRLAALSALQATVDAPRRFRVTKRPRRLERA